MLWAGVPLVALFGDTFASRVSSSILAAAGLPELTTTSLESYFQRALGLATHPAELAQLRTRAQSSRSSALFDTRRFTRKLEDALNAIWHRHQAGLPPDHVQLE